MRYPLTLRWFLLGLVLAVTMSRVATAQAPEEFGYNRIEAKGPRPLLVVLTQFDTYPALTHDANYYDQIAFNTFGQPASNNPSLSGYFIENSNGRFFWTRAGQGVVGPYFFSKDDVGAEKGGQLGRINTVLAAVAKDGFQFEQYDDNGDGNVTTNELTVLIVDNLTDTGAANRSSDPLCFKPEGSTVSLCLQAALVGRQASFMSMAHEIMHSLGVVDLYGSNDHSQGYTTMCATIYPELDDLRSFHLDPFHKMQLGWVEPQIRSLRSPGSASLGVASLAQDDEPLILYDPYRGTDEYFILEYRSTTTSLGRGYEDDLPSNGLAIWQVKLTDGKVPAHIPSMVSNDYLDAAVFILGAPSMQRGHGTLWGTGDEYLLGYRLIPYPLRWLDTRSSGVQIKVGKTADSGKRLRVQWGDFSEAPAVHKKILYYNNSTQLAVVGRFEENGDHVTINGFYPGGTRWTSVVSLGSEVFYYDAVTGTALLGRLDAAGNQTTVLYYPPGNFGVGWSHIVSHKGYLFFYNDQNGMAAIGTIGSGGFRQYKHYPAYSFGIGWTHVVSTSGGLLFYNGSNGLGAVGDWEFSYQTCPGFCFPTISEVRFKQLTSYPAGTFTYGWTSIVETTNGVLFYRQSDGLQVMADVNSGGQVSTRFHTVRYIKPGYTGVVAAGDEILLYNAADGDAALAEVLKPSPWLVARAIGSLDIRREYTGYFSAGWSHLAAVTDPTVIR